MNCLKIVKTIAGIIIVAGFILMLGTVGTSDYMIEIGQYYPLSAMLPQMIIGLVMMFAGGFVIQWLEENFEQEGSDEE